MSGYADLLKHDGKILFPVCLGHFLSHFYLFCLGPLIIVIHQELGISYMDLGAIITVFALTSGAAQTPVGFLVDRIGAGLVLVAGLFLMAGAVTLMGLSQNYTSLLALAVVAGIGHSVFHPANYAILSLKIDKSRLGKAFSLHTFASQLGNASVPIIMSSLLAFYDWRLALIIVGCAGIGTVFWFLMLSRAISGPRVQPTSAEIKNKSAVPDDTAGWALLLSPPMLMMFYFFFIVAFTSTGVLTFSTASFILVQGLSTLEAGTALSGFMLASATGVLVGGVVADRMSQHDLLAVLTFAITAIVMTVLGAFTLPYILILLLYIFVGFFQGLLRPARDMMIQAAAPQGGLGKVFGFVSTGISIGSGTAPLLFGWLIDQNKPEWIFYSIAILMALGIVSVIGTQKSFARVRQY